MTSIRWLWSAEFGAQKLALLVACMIGCETLVSWLVWRLFHLGTAKGWLSAAWHSWAGRGVVQIGRLLCYVGVPLGVWMRNEFLLEMGVPTSGRYGGSAFWYLMGLNQADDMLRLGYGIALGLVGLVGLAAIWIGYARLVPGIENGPFFSWWQVLREALFLQVHWAFYRSFAHTLTQDVVYVAFGGLALVMFSWVLNPLWRASFHHPGQGYRRVRDWILATLTAFLSIYVRSLWLLVLLYAAWLWTSDRVLQAARRRVELVQHKEA